MYCPFCSELATGLISEEFDIQLESRLIAETEHFAVVADISPLAPGHVLIIPKAHLINFGSVNKAEFGELDALIHRVKEVISRCYTTPIIMEHGSNTCADGGGCIAHAHLQVFPACIDMLPAISRFRVEQINDWIDLAKWSERDEPYLLFQTFEGKMFVADRLNGIEKQFIRIEIAKRIGLEGNNWDWRRQIFSQNVLETVNTLSDAWRN